MNRLTKVSLTLMMATLAYWAYAHFTASDLSNLDGDAVHFPSFSGVVGQTEVGWVVDQRAVVVWTVHDGTNRLLPILGRGDIVRALMSRQVWSEHSPNPSRWLPGAGQLRLTGRRADGTVSGRLTYLPIGYLAALFSVAPGVGCIRATYRRTRRLLRAARIARVRIARSQLGRCACGYDLRESRSPRCSECGRPIRWAPVAVPTV